LFTNALKTKLWNFLQFISLLSFQQLSNYSVQSRTGSLEQVLSQRIKQPMANLCERC